MSVSVSMPQLGESVTEGTVTRWLKKEGERVEADEPLLEVSTDKVDTEIPSPAAGVLRDIAVGEDETVEVGAQLAVIEEGADAPSDGSAAPGGPAESASSPAAAEQQAAPAPSAGGSDGAPGGAPVPNGSAGSAASRAPRVDTPAARRRPRRPGPRRPSSLRRPSRPRRRTSRRGRTGLTPPSRPLPRRPRRSSRLLPRPRRSRRPQAPAQDQGGQFAAPTPLPTGGDGPYVTPLVRKLAAEHGVDLESVSGTGVGGRIRKQDVLDAARARREAEATQQAAAPGPGRSAPAAPRRRRGPGGTRGSVRAVGTVPGRRSCRPRCAAPPSGCRGRAR